MAHIGRTYKIASRRDFNLNVQTNNEGWANRYTGYCTGFFFGLAGGIGEVDFEPGPFFQSQPDELDWSSPLKRIGLFFYKMELLVQIPDGVHFLRQVSYTIQGHGTILVMNWPTIDPEVKPGFPLNRHLEVVFWSPDWFDRQPTAVTAVIVPKVWAAGPPQ